jgi:hypothetical protein
VRLRSIHFDDTGAIAYIDARLTAQEAALIPGLLDDARLGPVALLPRQEPQVVAARLRRLTDAELVAFIDRIIERDPRAGRPVVQRELREQGFVGRNNKRLTRMVADRKRARLRVLALPLSAVGG